MCTAALGTDTGGSIRYPSAACGLSGLKPTHGRVSLRGIFPLSESLDHIGPMARSAADASRVFSVLCGFDDGDPWSLAANPSFATPSALVPSVRGVRIGVDRGYVEEGVHPEVLDAYQSVLSAFEKLGAEIVEIKMPSMDDVMGSWVSIVAVEAADAHASAFESKADEYGEALRATIESASQIDSRTLFHAWKDQTAFSRRLEGCFQDVDVLIVPVIPDLFDADLNLLDAAENPALSAAMRFTSPFNLSGSPSLTMCGGFDSEGAPIGFQLVGAHLDESRLLAFGAAYQNATDWHKRRPDLS